MFLNIVRKQNNIIMTYSLNALLLLLVFSFGSSSYLAQQGCDLTAIRAAFTSAGCTELNTCQTSCSMYFYNPQSLSGTAAQQFGENLGANLVSIQNATENSCIGSSLASNGIGGIVWIGLGDELSEGNFVWYDGAPSLFSNWGGGEPNNAGGGEDCTQIFADGSWNDLPVVVKVLHQ